MAVKKQRVKTGFTLIETIVAFAIIAIILVVAVIGFNTIASVSNRAQAWNEADESMEYAIANENFETAEDVLLKLTIIDQTEGNVGNLIGDKNDYNNPFSFTGNVQTYINESNGSTLDILQFGPKP